MTKRERKYYLKKKKPRTIIDAFTENIREAIDDEIIRLLKKVAKGETIESDIVPFTIYK